MATWIDVGCVGGDCPRKDRCRRYIGKDERKIVMQSAPYHKGLEGNPCNYYEHQKEEG